MLVNNKGLLIVVNFNSWYYVEKLYLNVKKYIGVEIDFLIIDGNSSENCPELFKNKLIGEPNVFVIQNVENLGYYNSVVENFHNIKVNKYQYFIVSNCDIEFVNHDFFQIVSNSIKDHKIIAPSIRNNQGVEQNPHRLKRPGFFIKFFWFIFYTNFFVSKIISLGFYFSSAIKFFSRKRSNPQDQFENMYQIYSPHGSCIIYSNEAFVHFFSKRFPFFLYAEEDYIGAMSLIQGFKISFIKNLKVLHFENVSTGLIVSKDKYNIKKNAFNNAIRPFWVFF